jgi:NitT/TauT family transport system substrate-binding protein
LSTREKPVTTHYLAVLGIGVVAVVATACSSGQSSSAPAESLSASAPRNAVVNVSYRGPFPVGVYDVPFYYAESLGYFSAAGLNVDLRQGATSLETVNDVNSGGSDFGLAATAVLMPAIGKGETVKAVASTIGASSFGFIVPNDSLMKSLPDLTGHSVAATSAALPLIKATLDSASVSVADVNVVTVAPNALVSSYTSGQVDAIYTTAVSYLPLVNGTRPSHVILGSSGGFSPPDYALIVNKDELASRPDVVRAFTAAVLKGNQAANKDPAAAAAVIVAKFPQLKATQSDIVAQLEGIAGYLCSPNQKGQPYGFNAAADWSVAAEQLAVKDPTNTENFFTNELFTGRSAINVASC